MRIAIAPKNEKEAQRRILLAREKTLAEHKKHYAHHTKKKTNWTKIALWTVVIIALIVLWKLINVPELLLTLLQKNPTVWSLYQTIAQEIQARTLLGLFYASFFGGLFFVSLPVEVIFLYYLGLNYYVVQVTTVVMLGNMLGMALNYFIGRLIGERLVQKLMKESYPKFMKKLDRAGAFLILVGNILPFPIEPFAVFLGAVKYKFSRFMLWTFIGKLLKFAILAFGYIYFLKFASPYLDTLSVDWFVQNIKNIFVFW